MDTTERDIRSLFANTGELDRDEIACLLLQLVERIQNLESSQPKREPMTNEQIAEFFGVKAVDESFVDFVRAIEAAHGIKEKNT